MVYGLDCIYKYVVGCWFIYRVLLQQFAEEKEGIGLGFIHQALLRQFAEMQRENWFLGFVLQLKPKTNEILYKAGCQQ